MKPKLAIIGGGVSGVTLAKLSAEKFDVTIFEREDSLLQKLLRTGNGKANIYNRIMVPHSYNEADFLDKHPLIPPRLDALFDKFGILTYTDEMGRVYPYSRSAKALRNALIKDLEAEVKLNHNVNSIKRNGEKYLIDGEEFDYVALTMGSSAGLRKYLLDNGNTALLNSLNLYTTELVPVIKTIKVKENLKRIEHERMNVVMSFHADEYILARDAGEVLFKKDGLSGIVSFIMSSFLEWAVREEANHDYYFTLDLMPDFSAEEVAEIIKTEDDFDNVFSLNMSHYLKGREGGVVERVKALKFTPVPGNNPENASAMHGGIPLPLLNEDFEVIASPNLFALGEVVDLDGMCGGFNLAFAFYSATLVNDALLRKLLI